LRDELNGTIKFIFQPAEEGQGGAESMITDGVLDGPKVDFTLGLHLWNEQPVGWVGVANGPMMAGAEKFKITLTGKGGHGAIPHLAVDPIVAGAQVVSALQSIVSRNIAPLKSAVISVTRFQAGDAFNVIPQTAELAGTIRTFELDVRETVLKRFFAVVNGVAESLGCKAEIEHTRMTPALINDPRIAAFPQAAAKKILPTHTLDTTSMTMGSEDFAYFMEKVPGCFFFVGSANADKNLNYPHHHPKFDVDEAALPHAAALMAQAAVEALNSK
jgi:amidohydrolase